MTVKVDYAGIGQKIFELRTSKKPKKVSREKLAEAVGVSGTSVYRWENGIDRPELEHLAKVAEFFEVPLSDLIDTPTVPNELIVKSASAAYEARQMEGIKKLIEPLNLTKKESDLLSAFRLLTDEGQNIVLSHVDTFLDKHRRPLLSNRAK